MDASEVKRIVEANIGVMVDALCVGHWRIEINYTKTGNENWKAKCDRSGSDYFHAYLTFDPEHHDDERDVLRSLRHELLHLHLAPFDLYRDLMTQHIDDENSPQFRQEQCAWTFAVEQALGNLERTFVNLPKDSLKLVSDLKPVKRKPTP